jgi:triacylglycerol lipase
MMDRWTTASREMAAFARQAWLLRHDIEAPVVPEGCVAGDDVVVFLHGLFATAGVLRPIRAAIARHPGVHAAALTYPPGPGVKLLASRLHELLQGLPADARIHLVGHSLGGIVARWFTQEIGDARVAQTISMATPFAGVPRARLLGFDGARDLDVSSPLLRELALGRAASAAGERDGARQVPHLSIIAGSDGMVQSPVSHALPGGEVIVLAGRGHNTLLFDPEAAAIIERRVLAMRNQACADAAE